jgi:H+/gluconate symporter-like permease
LYGYTLSGLTGIDSVTLSMIGIIVAMVLVLYLIMKGVNIFLIVFLCSTIVALTGEIDLYQALKIHFMGNLTAKVVEVNGVATAVVNPLGGLVGFMRANYLIFLTGTLLGKMMTVTKAGKSIAQFLIKLFGKDKAIISVPLACGILGYGGVSAFVISFCVFPIALQIFREADLPRRFMPGALTFGCSTFAMIAPGALQIHNAIPAGFLGTKLTAGMTVGFLSCGVMLLIGCIWLFHDCAVARKNGEHFVAKPMDVFGEGEENLPHWFIALIPLIVTVTLVNVPILEVGGKKVPVMFLESGLLVGSILAYVLMRKFQDNDNVLVDNLVESCKNSMSAIVNTCAVVGFGSVVQAAKAFPVITNAVLAIPGPPLVGVAVAMNVIAGICGSASGALGIATPLIAPAYLARGISADIIHRTLSVASSAMDSLPHNGYIITVTNGVCNETHKDSYGLTFKLTVIVPAIGTAVAVALFTMFPNWP